MIVEPSPISRFSIRHVGGVALALTIAVSVSNGCSQTPESRQIGFARQVKSECKPRDDDEFFFPTRTFSTSDDDGSSRQYDYSSYLATAGEPSLSCGGTLDQAYRLVWVQALRPGPSIIRVSRSGQTFALVAYGLEDKENSSTPVVMRVNKTLTEAEWGMVTSAIEQTNFWFMPTWHIRTSHDSAVLDSSTWLFESREASSYHVILRTSFEGKGPFVSACRLFFKLAGLVVPDELQSYGSFLLRGPS